MLALILAAALSAPLQAGDATTRSVLTDVCLPYVVGEGDEQAALDFLGFIAGADVEGGRDLQSEDQSYLLRLRSEEDEQAGLAWRSCELQARRINLTAARSAVRGPLEQAGFVADAGQPASRPIWTRAGVMVSLRQNEGRATVVRVSYSNIDQ